MELDEEIIIRCHEVNDGILKLISKLKKEKAVILGYDECNIHRLHIADVYYFEAVDNKVFIYCKDKVFESRQKLYEIVLQFFNCYLKNEGSFHPEDKY